MSAEGRKCRVAIVGGGVGGLFFAVSLAKCNADVDVDIYESTAQFSEIGAGLAMWPRVWDIMRVLGLEQDLKGRLSTGEKGEKFRYRKSDEEDGYEFGQSKTEMLPYHRADFLKVLVSHIPAHYNTHLSKRLESYVDSSSGPVTLHFKDGSSAECDLLVGADGIKSAVRRCMYEQLSQTGDDGEAPRQQYSRFFEPRWTGQVVYRALVPREELETAFPGHASLQAPTYYIGKDKYFITYPVSQGKIINCAALVSNPSQYGTVYDGPLMTAVSHEELLAEFQDWEPQALAMLNLMKDPARWVINTVEGLPTFVSGRVALLGDAAHAMSPHQASGAGQAVEDALVLATMLAQPEAQKDTLQHVLRIYDDVRRPFAQNVLELSFKTGAMYSMQSPHFLAVTSADSASGKVPRGQMQALSDELGDILRWTWTTSVQDDCDDALRRLRTKTQTRSVL